MQQIMDKGAETAARDLPGRAQDMDVEVGGVGDPPGCSATITESGRRQL